MAEYVAQNVRHVIADYVSANLMPDPRGRTVWDLGCGDGRFTRAFLQCGADRVLASDLHLPDSATIRSLGEDHRVEWLVGGFPEAARKWGKPVTADIIFMSLMTEHVSDPREFFKVLASMAGPSTHVLIHHDNFFHPVGHHDHGFLFLNEQSWTIDPQGVPC